MHLPGRDLLHLPLLLQFQLPGRTIPVTAIIDSEACSCVVDSVFVTLHQLPVCTKRQGFTVHLAETVPILCQTSSDHQELLRLDVITSPMFPVILGLPWLRAHNPHIDWLTGDMSFSCNCQRHCYPEKSANPAPLLSIHSDPDTMKLVPVAYHEFLDVFNKKNAENSSSPPDLRLFH